MTRRLLLILNVVSLSILSSCGGGGSPSAPTPTPKPVSGVLTVNVLGACGTREDGGVKLHVEVRYLETAGGSTTLTRADFTVKQNGVIIGTYESIESHIIGARGSLELEYSSTEANNDPYPTTVEVRGTYTDASGTVKTATASGTFSAIPG